MTFLKLNNITVPVASCSADHGVIGGMSRALGGDLLSDVRAIKRVWKMTTQPMSLATAYALTGMLNGRGQLFTFDTESYSASGFAATSEQGVTFDNGTTQITGNTAADGDAVKNLYDATNADGFAARTACVSSDSASTNLLAADERDMEGTPSTDWSKVNGTETFADDTTNFMQGSQSLQITKAAAAGNYGAYVSGVAVAAATKHAFSICVKSNSASSLTGFKVKLSDDVDTTGNTESFTLPSNGIWYRIWAIHETDAAATTARVEVFNSDSLNARDFSVDCAQLEALAYPTAWVDGARATDGDIVYPASIIDYVADNSWTIACWANGSLIADASGADGVAWNFRQSFEVNDAAFAFDSGTGRGKFTIVDSDGNSSTVTGTAGTYGPWLHYACVYNAVDGKSYLYENGVSVGTPQTIANFTTENSANLTVGDNAALTRSLNGQIDDLMILPYAITATEAAAMYASGTAPTIGYPRLVATGDFAPDASVTVRGAKVRTSNLYCDGNNNHKIVDFELQEV